MAGERTRGGATRLGPAALVALVVLSVLCVLPGCVGSSGSAADYEEKVANSAEAVRSSVETVRLVVAAVEQGKAPGPYTGRALSDAEGVVDSVSTQLGSVQPPDRGSTKLRADFMTLLDKCRAALSELRIAARGGEPERLPSLAKPLPGLSARLGHYQSLAPT